MTPSSGSLHLQTPPVKSHQNGYVVCLFLVTQMPVRLRLFEKSVACSCLATLYPVPEPLSPQQRITLICWRRCHHRIKKWLVVCGRQTITWTNDDKLSIGPLWRYSVILNHKTQLVLDENAFGDVVCKMSAILFRPQYVSKRVPENGERCINSWDPSDAIWRNRAWATLAQVMLWNVPVV